MTVRDANSWPEGILHPESEHTSEQPCMPHLLYDETVMGAKYPSLKAPAQLDVYDAQNDAWDHIYQQGLREARDIVADGERSERSPAGVRYGR